MVDIIDKIGRIVFAPVYETRELQTALVQAEIQARMNEVEERRKRITSPFVGMKHFQELMELMGNPDRTTHEWAVSPLMAIALTLYYIDAYGEVSGVPVSLYGYPVRITDDRGYMFDLRLKEQSE